MSARQLEASEREALLALLEAHVCHDAKERADRDAIAAFVRAHDDAHLRQNPLGHLTGSAFVLRQSATGDHEVLLTHHRKLRRWLQLGGHGEGEWDPARIALREAHEESGLEALAFHRVCAAPRRASSIAPIAIPFDVDIHEIPANAREGAHLHLDLRYVLLAPPDARIRQNEAESSALAWFAIAAARGLDVDASLDRALARLERLA